MKIKNGLVIDIKGRDGTIVHTATKDGKDYALFVFEEGGKMEFKVYEVKYENNELFVRREETDEELVADMMFEFTKANIILGKED